MKEFIYGRNAVYETLRAKRREFFSLEVADGVKETGRITEILELAALHRVGAKLVPRAKLERLKANHQGVALEVGDYPYSDLVEILERAREKNEPPFILMLELAARPAELWRSAAYGGSGRSARRCDPFGTDGRGHARSGQRLLRCQ